MNAKEIRAFVALRLRDVASSNGCVGTRDGICIQLSPDDPVEWCKYCVQGEAAKIIELDAALRACAEAPEMEQVKDAVRRALARVVADGGEERFISAGYEAHDAIVEAVCEELAGASGEHRVSQLQPDDVVAWGTAPTMPTARGESTSRESDIATAILRDHDALCFRCAGRGLQLLPVPVARPACPACFKLRDAIADALRAAALAPSPDTDGKQE